MHFIEDSNCNQTLGGVDLNRNYGYKYGVGDTQNDPCSEIYNGQSAFSEPETQAMRDWLTAHKNEIKFVYNFHSWGNMYITPYNSEVPNNLAEENPETY